MHVLILSRLGDKMVTCRSRDTSLCATLKTQAAAAEAVVVAEAAAVTAGVDSCGMATRTMIVIFEGEVVISQAGNNESDDNS